MMKNILFLLCLCTVTGQDGHITCTVPPVKVLGDTILTCNFPEDLNVTRKDFTVYYNPTNDRDAVVDCWWLRGNMSCDGKPYVKFDLSVSRSFKITFRNVTSTVAGTYECQVANYDPKLFTACQLEIVNVTTNIDENQDNGLSIGLIASLTACCLCGVLLIPVFIFFIQRYKRHRATSDIIQDQQQPMRKDQYNRLTKKFQDVLLEEVKKMYPNMLGGFYFVPPVYFNKSLCTPQTVADKIIYVLDPPEPSLVRQDQAMQHVLHCLRHMVEKENEQMFVLTQFKYEDYLNSPGLGFKNHRLPTFSCLKGESKNKGTECFDFLFIHRHHGVLVGVVKAVKDDCSQNGEEAIDDTLVSDVTEAIRQLGKADRIIHHLLSDLGHIRLRLTLMLPNVTFSTLQRAFTKHTSVAQDLHDCMRLRETDDLTQLCLCADYLSNPSAPWDVDSTVISRLRTWWERVINFPTDEPKMTDKLFQSIISRFCGPATHSGLNFPNEFEHYELPKTLNQAVSLTGDVFEQYHIYSDMRNLLDKRRMILKGPPGTGKTRMLALVGRKWITEGQTVYLINTWDEGGEATMELERLLQQTSSTQSQATPRQKTINMVLCIGDDDKKLDDTIQLLINHATDKKLFALVDELNPETKKLKQVKKFLQSLRDKIPSLHLWMASCSHDFKPPGWKERFLTKPLSLPPAVVRQSEQGSPNDGGNEYILYKQLPPTDGLPVKIFHHLGQGHKWIEPRDCDACGVDIATFFKRDLSLTDRDKNIIAMETRPATHETARSQPSALQYKDNVI